MLADAAAAEQCPTGFLPHEEISPCKIVFVAVAFNDGVPYVSSPIKKIFPP